MRLPAAFPLSLLLAWVTPMTAQALAQAPPPPEARQALPTRLDAEQLLEDVRILASPEFEGRRPKTGGHRRAQAYLARRLADSGLPPLGAAVPLRYRAHGGGTNFAVVAKGTVHPEACLFVTAHYDHLGILDGRLHPGADDNASGTAAVLALASWFKAHPPRHTLVFALFDDEERGMFGSRAFVASAPWKPLKPVLALNADMLSRSGKGELWISGLRALPAWTAVFEPLAGKVPVALRFGHDVPRRPKPDEDWSEASDHVSFARAGLPALYVGVEDHEDYHRPSDSFERLQKDFYLRACEALLRIVEAADGAGSPGR